MNEEQIDRVIDGLSKVADKLGETGTHIYEVLVRQVYVSGFMFLLWSILFLSVIGIFVKWFLPKIKNYEYRYDSNRAMAMAFSLAGPLVLVAVAFIFIVFATARFINPEYYAIIEIISMVRGY